MSGSCITCVHAGTTVDDDGDPLMECHRYPPQIWFNIDDAGPNQAYPTVREEDWCGEYVEG